MKKATKKDARIVPPKIMSDRSLGSTTPSIVAGSAGIFPPSKGSWSKVDSDPLGAPSAGAPSLNLDSVPGGRADPPERAILASASDDRSPDLSRLQGGSRRPEHSSRAQVWCMRGGQIEMVSC